MKRKEIRDQIESYIDLVNSDIPKQEKDFAEKKIQELKKQLREMNNKTEITGGSMEDRQLRKRAQQEADYFAKKYSKITDPKKISKLFDQQEDDNAHTYNALLLAVKYGDAADITLAKNNLITGYIENDASSFIKERDQMLTDLYPKLLADLKKKEISAHASDEAAAEKELKAEGEKISKQIEDLKELVKTDIPKEEKDFAERKIKKLETELESLKKNKVSMAKKKRVHAEKKASKKHIKTNLKSHTTGTKPFVPREKKRPGRKLGWRKPITTDINSRGKRTGNLPSIYSALKVKKVLARHVGHALTQEGIKYAIVLGDSKYTIYALLTASNLEKAYEIYSKIAKENDVKVKKSETLTKV